MTDTTTETDLVFHGDLPDRMVPADQVTPHPDNPRTGDVDVIIESMRTNGVFRPLFVQTSTGHILAGNHTYQALQRLGATEVPVSWLDVDDDRARRILLADNRASDLGVYDDQALYDLLDGLQGELDGTGYADDDLADLLIKLEADATDIVETGENTKGIRDDYETEGRGKVDRRIIVLDLSVDRYLWLIDGLRQVCDARNVDSNAAAVLLLTADFTGTPVPRENEGLDEEPDDE